MANLARCLACGADVDTDKPQGWNGRHRYGCLGPATWSGKLEGCYWGHNCWCGEPAIIRVDRNMTELWACCPEHARSRKAAQRATTNPFGVFVSACMKH